MTTNLYTIRDKMIAFEKSLPSSCKAAVDVYHQDLNAHGRFQPRAHRTDVTPSVLADRLPELLTGGLGLGAQIVAFRRINPIKAKTPGPWKAAARDVLTDLAQLLDPQLEHSRAKRIAEDAVVMALPLIQGWLDGESA
jgi:hypothetical protein